MPWGRIAGGEPRSMTQKSTAAIAQGAVVKLSGSGGCVVATGDDVGICGLARYAGDNVVGAPVAVCQDGKFDANAGGTITAGDPLFATTAGAVVTATGTGTHNIVGEAEEDAVSGDKVSVRINPRKHYIP